VFGALNIDDNLKVGAGMRADKHQVAGDLDQADRAFHVLAERRTRGRHMLSAARQQNV